MSLVIHLFLLVDVQMLIAFGTVFYAIVGAFSRAIVVGISYSDQTSDLPGYNVYALSHLS